MYLLKKEGKPHRAGARRAARGARRKCRDGALLSPKYWEDTV